MNGVRPSIFLFLLLGVFVVTSGCSKYGTKSTDECQNQAQCNPGKTCGQMVQCVDGNCDPAVLIELPCNTGCTSDGDCPADMHCRLDGQSGECVADGTCRDASECAGLPHDECAGLFLCSDGLCQWRCSDVGSCDGDSECVLADKNCCCSNHTDDYVAVNSDNLNDWLNRPECADIFCPEFACKVPDSIEAFCQAGQCQVVPKSTNLNSCNSDADCVPLPDNCCGCFDGYSSYVGIHMDRVSDWYSRPECADIQCEDCGFHPQKAKPVCWGDGCVTAHCQLDPGGQGTCVADLLDPNACQSDPDCAKAPSSCPSCDCEAGYGEAALNAELLEAALAFMNYTCSMMGACAIGPFGTDACTDLPAICHQGQCEVLGQTCDCPQVWDPVCASRPGDGLQTFPNPCQAECGWGEEAEIYPGRCECMVDCDCYDEYMCQACASNGQTFGCSYWEIECNGLEPLYPGECNSECDYCAYLNRMPIQACGEDFFTYAEMCYAECLGRDYWHTGPCDRDEGVSCGQGAGVPCPNENLFCLVDETSPAALGSCIRLGSCIEARHCEDQPLVTPNCVGHWTCPDHECAYQCD